MPDIDHPGTVLDIKNGEVTVKITRASPCGNCQARMACGSEAEDSILKIRGFYPELKPGDTVSVHICRSTGMKAVLIGYILPFLVFLSSFFLFQFLFKHEDLAGLFGLLMLGPYFLIIRLLRKQLADKFSLTLTRTP
jgi:sigma-E factor negative regulatory protein RseC